ncbi:hypothetical protein SAMD00019534_098920 [Acytostelium subglobosum LB1]|uniref:hypothetical protein n=1 Tax=Acytostelium subglobosum LB1 TaxID=1410327 RepID=UPI000644FEFC|nr:hypothetical protein SAMD00019534_098920 [Acytostelium subglobosum LB1]GAM26717.1 hypothetical protein SAMD00019534_098920 [Acytostelium subglobosum LB1]|eukprot:XP_012750378.1 hypothetical protein SAMD00019534_098920 [Acytostelium subglobosum LB1]
MNILLQLQGEHAPDITDEILQQFPTEVKQYIDNNWRQFPVGNIHLLIQINALGYLGDAAIDDILGKLKEEPKEFIQQFIDSSINPTQIWFRYIDNNINNHIHDNEFRKMKFIESLLKPNPATTFHFLKYNYSFQLMDAIHSAPSNYKEVKHSLLEKFDTQHPEYIKHRQIFKQFKNNSILKENLFAKSKETIISEDTPMAPLPMLSHLLMAYIVEFIVLAYPHDVPSLVHLSTVSKLLHKAVSMALSNNVLPTLPILSMINIGSEFCLLRTPPLHLHFKDLVHIPLAHLPICLERLQSITIPLCSSYPMILVPFVHVPNIRHITFVDAPTNSRIDHIDPDTYGPNTIRSYEHNFPMEQLFEHLYDHYIKDNPLIQKIDIHSTMPKNPFLLLPANHAIERSFVLDMTKNESSFSVYGMTSDDLQHITSLIFGFDQHSDSYQFPTVTSRMGNLRELQLSYYEYYDNSNYFGESSRLIYEDLKHLHTLNITLPDLKDVSEVLPDVTTPLRSLYIRLFDIRSMATMDANGTLQTHLDHLVAHLSQTIFNSLTLISFVLEPLQTHDPYLGPNPNSPNPNSPITLFLNQQMLIKALQPLGFHQMAASINIFKRWTCPTTPVDSPVSSP